MAYARQRRKQLLENGVEAVETILGRSLSLSNAEDLIDLLRNGSTENGSILLEMNEHLSKLCPRSPRASNIQDASTAEERLRYFGDTCRHAGLSDEFVVHYKDIVDERSQNKAMNALVQIARLYTEKEIKFAGGSATSDASSPRYQSSSTSSSSSSSLPPSVAMNPSYNRQDIRSLSSNRRVNRARDRKQGEIDEHLRREQEWREEQARLHARTHCGACDKELKVATRFCPFCGAAQQQQENEASNNDEAGKEEEEDAQEESAAPRALPATPPSSSSAASPRALLATPPASPATGSGELPVTPLAQVRTAERDETAVLSPSALLSNDELANQDLPQKSILLSTPERKEEVKRRNEEKKRAVSFSAELPKPDWTKRTGPRVGNVNQFYSSKQREQKEYIDTLLQQRAKRLEAEEKARIAEEEERRAEKERRRAARRKSTSAAIGGGGGGGDKPQSPAAALASKAMHGSSPGSGRRRGSPSGARKRNSLRSLSSGRAMFVSGRPGSRERIEIDDDFEEEADGDDSSGDGDGDGEPTLFRCTSDTVAEEHAREQRSPAASLAGGGDTPSRSAKIKSRPPTVYVKKSAPLSNSAAGATQAPRSKPAFGKSSSSRSTASRGGRTKLLNRYPAARRSARGGFREKVYSSSSSDDEDDSYGDDSYGDEDVSDSDPFGDASASAVSAESI
jgi:hypothetical protein